jgi:F-type H+-transporting ATPase subunit b
MSFLPFLIIQIIIFAALVLGLRRMLSRNVTDAAAHLQGLSDEYSRRQEELKQRLEESERQYNEQVTRARTEAEQLVAEARQEAEAQRTRRLDEARLESERIVQQGMESRDALRKELEREMDARALERACDLLQEALPNDVRQDLQHHWLNQLLQNGMEGLDRLKAANGASEIKVTTALPLTKEQREKLKARLKEVIKKDVTLDEQTDERLVAGFTITAGSLVFDSSLASKVRQTMRRNLNAS